MASNRRFILLIFGVKLADVRANNTSINDNYSTAPSKSIKDKSLIDFANYCDLPHTFSNSEEFLKTTNLLCWHCSLSFNGPPRFIPIESIRIPKNTFSECKWNIDGNFCSWACVAAYIEQYYTNNKKWNLLQNLAVVRAQIDHVPIKHIKPAPIRIKMHSYCGKSGMSQQEYSELVKSLSADVH